MSGRRVPTERTPVIAGAAQALNLSDQLDRVVDALGLMEQALVGAADDSGSPALLDRLQHIAVIQGSWRWPDPGRILAERVGARWARTAVAMSSGSTTQALVDWACKLIAEGRADVVAITGGEWMRGRRRCRAAGIPLPVTIQTSGEPDGRLGEQRVYETPLEVSRGFVEPLVMYPLFESAIAARLGEDRAETSQRVAALTARLSEVAATNPDAWSCHERSAAELLDTSGPNRMVVWPYTKYMVSNPDVDMAFALIICSVAMARACGSAADRWIFPWAGAEAEDSRPFSSLGRLDRSPQHELVLSGLLGAAGMGVDDVKYLDLYSCFPSAVFLQADALGIDPLARPVTITGGLPSGGPLASYQGHAVVRATRLLREDAGEVTLCAGNGGYLNKLASGLYGARPPSKPFTVVNRDREVARLPCRRVIPEEDTASGVLEAATVVFDRTGQKRALGTVITGDGARALGWSEAGEMIDAVLSRPCEGRPADVDKTGLLTLGS